MYSPRVEFCEICGVFEEVRRIDGHFICHSCVAAGKTFESNLNFDSGVRDLFVTNKPTKQKAATPGIKKKRIYKPKPKKDKVEKSIFDKKIQRVSIPTSRKLLLKFFQDNPDKSFRTKQLWENKELIGKCNNYNSFSNTLNTMHLKGEVYGRDVYINGRKAYKIYSLDENLVNQLDIKESIRAMEIIISSNNIVDTKLICETLKCSDRNVSKVIKTKMTNLIAIWKRGNKYYYTQRNNHEQIKTLQETVKGVKQVY
jgi:hypothetical protein